MMWGFPRNNGKSSTTDIAVVLQKYSCKSFCIGACPVSFAWADLMECGTSVADSVMSPLCDEYAVKKE